MDYEYFSRVPWGHDEDEEAWRVERHRRPRTCVISPLLIERSLQSVPGSDNLMMKILTNVFLLLLPFGANTFEIPKERQERRIEEIEIIIEESPKPPLIHRGKVIWCDCDSLQKCDSVRLYSIVYKSV